MREVKIEDQTYQVGRLPALKQFHIARRIAPLYAELAAAAQTIGSQEGRSEDQRDLDFLVHMGLPFAEALSKLSDETSEYIIFTCLSAVTKQQGQSWAPVLARDGRSLMFQDISMPTMIRLAGEVIAENLADFFVSTLPKSTGATA